MHFKHWNGQVREVIQSPSLEVLEKHEGVALRVTFSDWTQYVRLIFEPDDLEGLSNLNDSLVLKPLCLKEVIWFSRSDSAQD